MVRSYTEEDAAILIGFISPYLNRRSVCDSVRAGYTQLCSDLRQQAMTRQDYILAERTLRFLEPLWWTEREDRRALETVLLKTETLIKAWE